VEAWSADLRLRVGTSGWAYRHWLGRFYPRRLPGREMLAFHSRRFATVEVNSTFYRAPTERTMDAWREQTPPGHRLSLKMPRAITHDKRLADAQPEAREFLRLARRLGPKLGIVLVQMPPSFRADHALLDAFLAELPVDLQYAVELRHRSWRETAGATRRILERHGVARVVHDFGRKATPMAPTAPFVYLRLHGPTGRYRGSYDVETLLAWAHQLAAWAEGGYEAWCYLNNDERGHGARNALALRAYVDELLDDKTKHEAAHARGAWRDPLALLRAS
jgi:uncharacterized protein YecE (DUF72 family)